MDIGLVCDSCDAFNPMQSQTCSVCKSPLALGGPRRPSGPQPTNAPRLSAAQRAATPPPSPRPRVSAPNVASVSAAPGGMTACPTCGTALSAGNRFCPNCGTPIAAAAPAPAPPASSAPHQQVHGHAERKTMFFGAMQAARAKLVLIKGDGLDGISFTLAGQDHLAGRGNDCPLAFKEDPFLSPVHANFFYKDGKLQVRDESSANGVYIRIRAPMPLRSGDTFLVGEQVLRVETTPPETAGLGPDESGTYFYASPRRASRLRIIQLLRGGDIGLIYRAAGDTVTLGRDGNDINFPDDPFISGRHAQVSFSDAGLMLTDTGSKNGTFLRVSGEAPLHHGDYVFMGQQLLRVEIV
jgi:pSer/pThr/pTyr-binding forkhead associated (FHA) protein/RNA polymerase subunit RPABC4/transcription elongation factor Spt4